MELYAVNSLKESLFQYKVKNLGENPYAILMNQAFLCQLKYETYSDPRLSLEMYEKEETLYYGNIPILLQFRASHPTPLGVGWLAFNT